MRYDSNSLLVVCYDVFMSLFYRYDPNTIGSKGLVFIDDKILVYRRDGNTTFRPHELDLPGGAPEGKETPFETFKREVKEEFNLDISKEDLSLIHI